MGQGSHCSVVYGNYHATPVAIKRYSKDYKDVYLKEKSFYISVLEKHLCHPGLLNYMGSFRTKTEYCIITEVA